MAMHKAATKTMKNRLVENKAMNVSAINTCSIHESNIYSLHSVILSIWF